jgi:Common central domain of tyrosinase/Polyphenol oxidase middle domain
MRAGKRGAVLRSRDILSRRNILSGLVVAGGAGLAAPLRSGPPAARLAVREDITRLGDAPHRLAGLADAIGEMQRRSGADPDDPKGWAVHARAHTQVCSAVSNSDPAQVHGCWWFLPWHRAFLAVTEWKLRAISGDPTLALPYWNWSSDRRIPASFTRPGSALAQAARHTADRDLRPAEVDRLLHDDALASLGVAALGARSFLARTPEQIPGSFGGIARPNPAGWHGRSRMETIPHTAIHNYVGGEAADGALGDMTELATAASDPVFYAHHGNLDRLWEAWRQDPARKATEPEFTQERFLFRWIDGSVVAVAVEDTLDTQRLGYVYDSLLVLRDGVAPAGDAVARDVTRQPLVVAKIRLPSGAARFTLRITGVSPADRPLTVEIALARPGDPESWVSVGAHAMGRKHSDATFPDTELCFDITAAVHRLGVSAVVVSIVPLPLGPSQRSWPAFEYAGMEILGSPA